MVQCFTVDNTGVNNYYGPNMWEYKSSLSSCGALGNLIQTQATLSGIASFDQPYIPLTVSDALCILNTSMTIVPTNSYYGLNLHAYPSQDWDGVIHNFFKDRFSLFTRNELVPFSDLFFDIDLFTAGNWLASLPNQFYINESWVILALATCNSSPAAWAPGNDQSATQSANLLTALNLQSGVIPIAGRIVTSKITPIYFNQSPLVSHRGGLGLMTSSELKQNGYHTAVTNFHILRTHKVAIVRNYNLLNNNSLAPLFNVSNIVEQGDIAGPASNSMTKQQFDPSQGIDLSDPLQSTLITSSSIYGDIPPNAMVDISTTGMIFLRVSGFYFATDCNTVINGVSSSRVIPCVITTGAQALQTIAFNSALDFEIEAQTLTNLTYELFDINLQPLRSLQNVRYILTFTPINGPTSNQQAFQTGETLLSAQQESNTQAITQGASSIFEENRSKAPVKRAKLEGSSSYTRFSAPGNTPKLKPTYFSS